MKPQTNGLLAGKLKHKVLREPVGIALNGKIQGFGGNAIEFGEVCIEHDLLAERYKAGDSMDALTKDYGCERAQVEEAVRCELALAA
jgi:hypothetical protein